MSDSIKQEFKTILRQRNKVITGLRGYIYKLWRYDISHSILTIRAIDPNQKKSCFFITLSSVSYLKILLSWTGNFELVPKVERIKIARSVGFDTDVDDDELDDLLIQGLFTMLQVNAPEGKVCIFGHLQEIETCD